MRVKPAVHLHKPWRMCYISSRRSCDCLLQDSQDATQSVALTFVLILGRFFCNLSETETDVSGIVDDSQQIYNDLMADTIPISEVWARSDHIQSLVFAGGMQGGAKVDC